MGCYASIMLTGFAYAGDDSLRRILRQGIKSQTMLQMRVPREQDLLSVSEYESWILIMETDGC